VNMPATYFDDMYRRDPDPWGFASRWYERRKYALTLAALLRRRYRRALEIGCSIGIFTAQLAVRCDDLLAVDVAAAAVDAARTRVADRPQVTVERRALPDEFPPGRFDLVVLAEVGYYLDAGGLDKLLAAIAGALEPDGDLVAVHWRHPVAGYPLRGDAVHAALGRTAGLTRTVAHVEADFQLDVYTTTPPVARSVAHREGLC